MVLVGLGQSLVKIPGLRDLKEYFVPLVLTTFFQFFEVKLESKCLSVFPNDINATDLLYSVLLIGDSFYMLE